MVLDTQAGALHSIVSFAASPLVLLRDMAAAFPWWSRPWLPRDVELQGTPAVGRRVIEATGEDAVLLHLLGGVDVLGQATPGMRRVSHSLAFCSSVRSTP